VQQDQQGLLSGNFHLYKKVIKGGHTGANIIKKGCSCYGTAPDCRTSYYCK
jgi:hypothetical protein